MLFNLFIQSGYCLYFFTWLKISIYFILILLLFNEFCL